MKKKINLWIDNGETFKKAQNLGLNISKTVENCLKFYISKKGNENNNFEFLKKIKDIFGFPNKKLHNHKRITLLVDGKIYKKAKEDFGLNISRTVENLLKFYVTEMEKVNKKLKIKQFVKGRLR